MLPVCFDSTTCMNYQGKTPGSTLYFEPRHNSAPQTSMRIIWTTLLLLLQTQSILQALLYNKVSNPTLLQYKTVSLLQVPPTRPRQGMPWKAMVSWKIIWTMKHWKSHQASTMIKKKQNYKTHFYRVLPHKKVKSINSRKHIMLN